MEKRIYFTVTDLCELGHVNSQLVIEMVEYGILLPEGKKKQEWQFSENQLLRFKRAVRLTKDLELNVSGAALALELIEELKNLQSQISQLENQLKLLQINFDIEE